jgi:hypothetical protein
MENKILLINRCDYLVESFCKEHFKGSELIDGCVLIYNNKEYDLIRCEAIGMEVQRDIEIYRLSEYVE